MAQSIPPPLIEPEKPEKPQGVVIFDVDDFRLHYPKFNDLTDEQLQGFFDNACLFLENTPKSIVKDENERKKLLWLLVCHLSTLELRGDATGNVTSATEGSVSVGMSPLQYGKGQWFGQTPCGAMFWEAVRRYLLGGKTYVWRGYHG